VNELPWAADKPETFACFDAKPANSLDEPPIPDTPPIRPSGGTLLGTREDLSSRETVPLPPWGRWASHCHWRCQRCTERLAFLLVGQVLAVLPAISNEEQRPEIGSLSIAPPPGIRLGEIRHAVERLFLEHDGHSIWSLKIAHSGRVFAYALTTAIDRRQLERQGGSKVFGDSRSARFNQVRGSLGCWSPPDQAFAIHIGRVIRHLARSAPFSPPTLRPGYRFGASGIFAPLLTNALATLRREHPCQAVGPEHGNGSGKSHQRPKTPSFGLAGGATWRFSVGRGGIRTAQPGDGERISPCGQSWSRQTSTRSCIRWRS
jgi:hypothetical protein